MMNKIYTKAEYIAQGFTLEELPLIREHDELVNKVAEKGLENMTEIEGQRIEELAEKLGL